MLYGFNFDMSAAPRGNYKTITRVLNGNEVEQQVHVPVQIIAAGRDGETVTISKWLPKEERWNMFTKDSPPIAWMPWPDHPGWSAAAESIDDSSPLRRHAKAEEVKPSRRRDFDDLL